jgi:hypothetical protein
MRKLSLLGKKFGRLTVISQAATRNQKTFWLCSCECGSLIEVRGNHLTAGANSCGCDKAIQKESVTTHGMSKTGTYKSWDAMKQRCTNPRYRGYKDYGGRGIKVCDEWLHSFETFIADMGERPEGMSIERKNNDLGYFKENCRWATPKEQANNRRPRKALSEIDFGIE